MWRLMSQDRILKFFTCFGSTADGAPASLACATGSLRTVLLAPGGASYSTYCID